MHRVIAAGFDPPYIAVIFTSLRSGDLDGYDQTAAEMDRLAAVQPGYLGHEAARTPDGLGITVSYWVDEASATAWRGVAAHRDAQRQGRDRYYVDYRVRVARVDREHGKA